MKILLFVIVPVVAGFFASKFIVGEKYPHESKGDYITSRLLGFAFGFISACLLIAVAVSAKCP